jgi:hypothetical protein
MVMFIVFCCASAIVEASPSLERESRPIVETGDPPKTAHELLVKIKHALEDGSLLRKSFYTDEQLISFFGAKEMRWTVNKDLQKVGKMLDTSYIPIREHSPLSLGFGWYVLDADSRLNSSGKASGSIGLRCACLLRIEDVEQVFGTDRRTITENRGLPGTHYALPPPATDRFGNKIVSYQIDADRQYVASFTVKFDPAGNINAVDARQQEK